MGLTEGQAADGCTSLCLSSKWDSPPRSAELQPRAGSHRDFLQFPGMGRVRSWKEAT